MINMEILQQILENMYQNSKQDIYPLWIWLNKILLTFQSFRIMMEEANVFLTTQKNLTRGKVIFSFQRIGTLVVDK